MDYRPRRLHKSRDSPLLRLLSASYLLSVSRWFDVANSQRIKSFNIDVILMVELWQIHASFMVTGLILIIFVGVIARFLRAKPWWLKVHKTLATISLLIVLSGFLTAFYMVAISSGLHFTLPHHWTGLAGLIFAFLTVLVGVLRSQMGLSRTQYRWIHISLAFITAILMLLNIILGFGLV